MRQYPLYDAARHAAFRSGGTKGEDMELSTRKSREDGSRFGRPLTPEQRRALNTLGVGDKGFRHAASGLDLFAYVEDDHSTLRLQISPDGGVVGQTVLNREPH